MMVAVIEGCDQIIGKEQGFKGLPVRMGEFDGHPGMTTAWEPSPAELQLLLAGAKIHITLLGTAHPPISVGIGPVPQDGPD